MLVSYIICAVIVFILSLDVLVAERNHFEPWMLREAAIDGILFPLVIGICCYSIYKEWRGK